MRRNSKIILISSLLSMSIIGCSEGPQPPQIKSINPPKKEVVIKLNFPENDPVTKKKLKLHKNELLDEIKNNMYRFSHYRKYGIVKYGPINYLAGIKINYNDKEYKINYLNTQDYKTGTIYTTKVIFKTPYKFESKKISIRYPTNYIYEPSNDVMGFEIEPLDNPEKLKQDVFRILNKLPKSKLYLSKRYLLKGEINTKYPADSIYANFKRLMGQYTGYYYWTDSKERISPIEKENTFNLKIKDKIYPINIKVYPYRNGSKVIYKAYISYKIYSDGTSTLTKQDIENAKKEIERVVND